MSPPADSLGAHLRDARNHLGRVAHSLERAHAHAKNRRTDRELDELERYTDRLSHHLLRIGRRELGRMETRRS
jgi:hypothetical protein